ncbi:hypothetical protein MAMT_01687 [Methylacidimicrobium tartarophylax]|uniref:Uncharacterized protein n=1 Tax=Methylacidimicrobium tartarophylax TaxID=1041768 RepID=A0A5E6MPG7_9BACT|nr:hypothetical protein MAMT_01687 [Methylacidimicrobium tartarophylax]
MAAPPLTKRKTLLAYAEKFERNEAADEECLGQDLAR